MKIEAGKKVTLTYALYVEDKLVESVPEDKPVVYTHGEERVSPGLEQYLEGLQAGDVQEVLLPPEKGFGQVDPNKWVQALREHLPPGVEAKEGEVFQAKDQYGKPYQALITKVEEERVLLDLNHPLAGQTLQFKVQILDVVDA